MSLEQKPLFHIVDKLILDCMYDFHEGIFPIIIMLVFRKFSKNLKYVFFAEELNNRLKLFGYSYYDKENKSLPKFTDILIRKRGNYTLLKK